MAEKFEGSRKPNERWKLTGVAGNGLYRIHHPQRRVVVYVEGSIGAEWLLDYLNASDDRLDREFDASLERSHG